MDSEVKRMKRLPPHILVATPGRLVDHLQNQGLAAFASKLDTLVFDEADRLLDMGFRSAVIAASQPEQRQMGHVAFPYTYTTPEAASEQRK